MLREAQPRQLGAAGVVEIVRQVQGTFAEVEKWQSEVSRARVELVKLSSELEGSRNSNFALKRGVNTS